MIKQVGNKYPPDYVPLSYLNVKKDVNGWVDVKKFLPIPFDLVQMDVGRRVLNGWYTGYTWEALRLNPEDKVLRWKKTPENYE